MLVILALFAHIIGLSNHFCIKSIYLLSELRIFGFCSCDSVPHEPGFGILEFKSTHRPRPAVRLILYMSWAGVIKFS
jgi:hypothetical protein